MQRNDTRLLSPIQAADYLGVSAHTLAIWSHTKRHALPILKVGRNVKYRLGDLKAFIQRYSSGMEVA